MNSLEKDFALFAKSRGISSHLLGDYDKKSILNTYVEPTVIEERNMNMTAISIYSRMLIDNIIFIGTEINDDVANIISAQLLWLEQQNGNDISLMINSGGGSVIGGYSIIDVCDFVKNDVSTTITGMAASMAAVIASNGTKGKRYGLPHARFMIHQPRMTFGNSPMVASDITIEAEEINKTKEELYRTLEKNSNLSYDEIKNLSDRDRWYNMQEAVADGFIDQIINSKNLIIKNSSN